MVITDLKEVGKVEIPSGNVRLVGIRADGSSVVLGRHEGFSTLVIYEETLVTHDEWEATEKAKEDKEPK